MGSRGVVRAGVARSGHPCERFAEAGRELATDPVQAFPGHGQVQPDQLEIDRLREEVAKLKAEPDILKKAELGSTGQRNGSFKGISWRLEAKCFPRPRIEG